LGNGKSGPGTDEKVPVKIKMDGVLNGKTTLSVYGGMHYVCALSSEYKLYCWGKNQ
jgi:hypothetical protein